MPDVPKNVINELLDIQEKDGYLSREAMVRLSKEKGIPGVNLYGVATFYGQFKLNKPGRHKISLCRGTACHVKGSGGLLEYIEDVLKIKSGQTTKDGKISLQTVNCLGACAKAPAMMIDDQVFGDLTKQKAKKIIEGLQ